MAFIQDFQRNTNFIQRMMIMLSVLAAGIATAVLMYTNVQHKTRAIGILKAIGGRNRAILQLYVLEGLLFGVAGAVVGDILGSAISLYLSAHPVQFSVGAAVGQGRLVSMAASFSWSLLIVPTINAIMVTTIASLYPAWQAARINIVEAIWHG
jgi:ABC-type lipoprotein release transport system permease subunit